MKTSNRKERGTVLILVLWVLALLTIIGGFYAVEARIRRNLGQYEWDNLCAREAAKSVLLLVANRLAPPGSKMEEALEEGLFVTDGTWYTVQIGGKEISFSIEDENGKVDLNNSKEDVIKKVIEALIGTKDSQRANEILDSLLDWRDKDSEVRPDGAEEDTYLDRIPPYEPSNGPFHTIEELLLVKGMSLELFYGPLNLLSDDGEVIDWDGGMQDLFTIYNKSGNVVEEYAPIPLKSILGDELLAKSPSAHTILCLKLKTGSQAYRIYWKPDPGEKRFQVVRWVETIPTGGKE